MPAHGRARPGALSGGCPRADALQRGRPRDGGLRHRSRRRARRVRGRARVPRLGRRDPSAPPGSTAHRLGARAARHPVRGDHRRRGRVVHGARRGETWSSPAPTGSRRTGTRRTRSAPTASPCSQPHHGLPFVVVAPTSTLDPSAATGAEIPIEERDPDEVWSRFPARNPAFDVTPGSLVSAIVTERGVHRLPYLDTLPRETAAVR